MRQLSSVKMACMTAVCIALCYVLPLAFHALGLGSVFSPMHIPVLLCGMVCGWGYGLFCGIAGPVLSSVLSGMPSAVGLITMVPELAVYGIVSGMMMKLVRTGKLSADLYLSLVAAMLLGRIAGGIASALFYMGTGRAFSVALWAASYLAGTLPGMLVHLIFVPLLVFMLMKSGVIPPRYSKTA